MVFATGIDTALVSALGEVRRNALFLETGVSILPVFCKPFPVHKTIQSPTKTGLSRDSNTEGIGGEND